MRVGLSLFERVVVLSLNLFDETHQLRVLIARISAHDGHLGQTSCLSLCASDAPLLQF